MKPIKMLLPLLFGSLLTQQTTAVPYTSSATQFKKSSSLHFIENKGQIVDQHHNPRPDIDFKIPAGNGLNIFIGAGKIHYQWSRAIENGNQDTDNTGSSLNPHPSSLVMYRMDVTLLNANPAAEVVTEERQSYYEQSYTTHTGPDGATAHTYRKITYREVYPHIDWVFRINDQGKLEHDFIVRPGGNVSDIRLQYSGADSLRCSSDGSVTAVTPLGTVTESTPYCFQEDGKAVSGKFILENNTLGFATASHHGILTIDPVLEWGTYFGGVGTDQVNGLNTDVWGNCYITGQTSSAANIATTGSYQDTFTAATDAFIARFDRRGTCIWSTYYGENGNDIGYSVACNTFGHVYMFGNTGSKNSMVTPGCHQATFGGGSRDAFLVQFDTSGQRIWATYLGGSRDEYQTGETTCDPWGNVYVSGATNSSNAISTTGAHQEAKQGSATSNDAFLMKFDKDGNRIWGTYFGGSAHDYGNAIACDATGNICIAGRTTSTSITGIAATSHQPGLGGAYDAFLAMFDSAGHCRWGTYYGGSGEESQQAAVICDHDGHIYLAGTTASTDSIATPGSYQPVLVSGGTDAFLAKFDTVGNRIRGTYFGGNLNDQGLALDADVNGNVYLAGLTMSTTGIADQGSLQPGNGGSHDAYVVKLDSAGQHIWGTFYGGSEVDYSQGISVDAWGNVYMGGLSRSITDFATAGGYQATHGGGDDGFLIRINDCNLTPPDTIIGATFICAGDTVRYAVPPVAGAIAYVWTLPSGWTGSSITDSITVVSGMSSDTIRVSAGFFCGSSAEQVLAVAVSPGAAISASGSAPLCADDSILLQANTTPGISWQWLHNGTVIVGKTDSMLLTLQSGSYSVSTTIGHCTDTSDPIIIHPLPQPVVTQDGNKLSTEAHYTAYQWYYESQSITGATQSVYTYAAKGAYSVVVTDTNGCTGMSGAFTPVSVGGLSIESSVYVYPNPAQSVIQVSAMAPVSVTIRSMEGRAVLRAEQAGSIDISSLANGLYLLQVTDLSRKIIHVEKLVKAVW